MNEPFKLELGGGTRPKPGFRNLDIIPGVEFSFDLNKIPPAQLPFDDLSVDEVFSGHCLEHVKDPYAVLVDVARIGKLGCPVEVRVPHYLSDCAMTPGHLHVLGLNSVRNVTHYFYGDWFKGKRRLRLDDVSYGPSEFLPELMQLHPGWSREQVLKYAPNAAHETIYKFTVIRND